MASFRRRLWNRFLAKMGTPAIPREALGLLQDLPALALSVKQLGYEFARRIGRELDQREVTEPPKTPLGSKACTQSDLESDWSVYWVRELNARPIMHRKRWEHSYVLQTLHAHGMLANGRRGIGFGCGREPLASYLAARGAEVVVTDLAPGEAAGRPWEKTGQHSASLEICYFPDIVSREDFDRRVSLQYVDMNDIPESLREQFDFCWSVCAFEHLGSIDNGLEFVAESMRCLRPGGVAVHTTEFNCGSDEDTFETETTVLFRQRDFRRLAERLSRQGYEVSPLDFDLGNKVLDGFVDVPPFVHDDTENSIYGDWVIAAGNLHLKLSIGGFPATCFGIAVTRPA